MLDKKISKKFFFRKNYVMKWWKQWKVVEAEAIQKLLLPHPWFKSFLLKKIGHTKIF